ncbi:hypothetical protein ZWY2020_033480 [Hordeum vulgare]|nr:hypothetical protein ZWY2020_033480 [Hordeum vulgare]
MGSYVQGEHQVPVYESGADALQKLQEKWKSTAAPYPAMYASFLGGIVGTPFARDPLRSILVQMTAASGCRKGSIRYWLSSGPGDFLLSSSGCPGPAFYAVVIPSDYAQCRDGVRAVTTSVPMKPPLFATMKNVNYLPNVLSIMDAEERGAFASVGGRARVRRRGAHGERRLRHPGRRARAPGVRRKVGKLMLALSDLLWEDMKSGPDRVAVPYK